MRRACRGGSLGSRSASASHVIGQWADLTIGIRPTRALRAPQCALARIVSVFV
jgi:hypothetical protein